MSGSDQARDDGQQRGKQAGRQSRARLRPLAIALLGVVCALPAVIYLWQFTVDDALISARYATNLARGHGYRFNAGGPVSDGVTALGWAPLLAPWAREGPLAALRAAKLLGLGSWLVGAGLLALAIDSLEVGRRKWLGLLLLMCSAPLAAWSVAGMETGLVLGMAAASVSLRALGRERAGLALAGLVAALRPEAVLWAGVLALSPARRAALPRPYAVALVMAPAMLVAALRLVIFGRALPLALIAKAPVFGHGVAYAAACLLLTGPLALLAWRGLPPWVRGLQAATAAHFVAIALSGGDWMPLSRLTVIALPAVVIAASQIVARGWAPLALSRLGLALAGEVFAFVQAGPAAAAVTEKRMAVIEQLAPALASSRSVATLDIGWVGAACDADIVDMAGVTDPAVAALPGGHTSKRIPPGLLSARSVDTLVLLLVRGYELADPWTDSHFARFSEAWLASHASVESRFAPMQVSAPPLRYVVLRRRGDDSEGSPPDTAEGRDVSPRR